MKIFKETLQVMAEDGKLFIGENAIERCCEYEKLQLKKQLIEEKFKAIDKKKIKIPLLHFFCDAIDEYNYVFWLRSEEDVKTIEQWWEIQNENSNSHFENELYKNDFPRMAYCIAMDNELYLMDVQNEQREASEFYCTLVNFEKCHK